MKTDKNLIEDILILEVPFEKQLEVLESLGYKLNGEVTEDEMLKGLQSFVEYDLRDDIKKSIKENPYEILYYGMGLRKYDEEKKEIIPYTNKCIWYDLEFIDQSSEYITLMKRMGEITEGELSFTDMSLSIDKDNFEWLSFKVNGIKKEWKLEKVNYIADSFFSQFTYLTNELKTKGKYTYFDNGSQQFVIDYATPQEQKEFNQKTGLQREWLTSGKHFSEPKTD
ncbi:hypothetical protein U8527_08865 [Kordia algicida OT-1]|uniref:hypothetical protein n=1 Tax=Kordia algicida TaxID=221066 RepID=UPI0012FA24A1|nr:hypothetical protein [Kordia algicida]